MCNQIVPKENIEIYCYLYCIENALREFIIEKSASIDGHKWYKIRLPDDVLKKYRKSVDAEYKAKWTQLIPHHPMYYIDFADIKKIMDRQDNWRDVFESAFGKKEILMGTLSELEFIRNKIAHNRKATPKDLDIVRGAYTKITEVIGPEKFNRFVVSVSSILDLLERMKKLEVSAAIYLRTVQNCQPVEKLEHWDSTLSEWWFDETYLGIKLDDIVIFYETLKDYAALPRQRGKGHIIEKWVKESDIEAKHQE